jgi:hypothetical protein
MSSENDGAKEPEIDKVGDAADVEALFEQAGSGARQSTYETESSGQRKSKKQKLVMSRQTK